MKDRTVVVAGYSAGKNDGEIVNPSLQLAHALHDTTVAGYRIEAVELPHSYAAVPRFLHELVHDTEASVIICLGVDLGAARITVERLGANRIWASRPDNAGDMPRNAEVVPGAPIAYWASLPVTGVVERMPEAASRRPPPKTPGRSRANRAVRPDARACERAAPGPRAGLSIPPRAARPT